MIWNPMERVLIATKINTKSQCTYTNSNKFYNISVQSQIAYEGYNYRIKFLCNACVLIIYSSYYYHTLVHTFQYEKMLPCLPALFHSRPFIWFSVNWIQTESVSGIWFLYRTLSTSISWKFGSPTNFESKSFKLLEFV